MNTEDVAFELILHAGNARAEAYEALRAAKRGDFEEAARRFSKAGEELAAAHEVQAGLLHAEAGEGGAPLSMLLVHAHGHLMTAMAERNLIEEMVGMYKAFSSQQSAFSLREEA